MSEYVEWGMGEPDDDDGDQGPTFEARYGGKCAGCGERIVAGDPVHYSEGQLIGEECCGE